MKLKTAALAATIVLGWSANLYADDSVYQAFGGQTGMVKVVDIFIDNVLADPRIKDQFTHADIPHLKEKLVEQFCALTGGPCTYTGKDMTTAHKGFGLHDAQFNALAEDLQYAMDRQGIPFRTQNHLVSQLASMEKQIVEAK